MILALVLTLYFKKGWKQTVLVVLAIALTILIADQVSSSIIKPLVARARPSHNDDLNATIHIVNGYRGGPFGFVSSHAANCFGVATLVALMFKNRVFTITLMAWSTLMCYSRIYLGVHYPGDIACGAVLGVITAWAVHRLCKAIAAKHPSLAVTGFSTGQEKFLVAVAIANFLLLAAAAILVAP